MALPGGIGSLLVLQPAHHEPHLHPQGCGETPGSHHAVEKQILAERIPCPVAG